MNLSTKQKALYVFSALFSLALFLVGRERIIQVIGGTNSGKVQVSTLLKEFSAVAIGKNDEMFGAPKSFDKGVITGVTAQISSPEPPAGVVSYYLETLSSLGWKLSSNTSKEGARKVKFCKGGISLIVDVSVSGAGSNYYLGLVWTKFPHSPAYCSQ